MKYKLGEICDFINGGAWSDKEYVNEGLPVLKVTNCKTQGFNLADINHLPLSLAKKYEKNKLKICDVIIATVGSHPNLIESAAGRTCIVNTLVDGFYLNQNAVCLRTKDKDILDQKYLGYHSKYRLFQHYIQMSGRGAANQMRIPINAIKNYEFDFPKIEIQQKVGKILSAYDDLIENNQKQIKLLEEAAQRLYKEWFVDLHFPGYETTPIIDGVPEGWEHTILENVISKITTGLNPRKNFVLGNGNNYYVTIKNMRNNNIYLDEKCDRIDDEAIIKINKRSDLQVGDILFSGIGTMGRVYLVNIPTDNWNVSESVFTLRANNKISKEFLYLMLLSDDVQIYCDQHAHGVAQRGIRMTDLKAYKFILPSKKIIENFTAIIKPIVEKIQNLHVQIVDVTEARDRLLPKLMSGELEG